jgi:hypothetical protein
MLLEIFLLESFPVGANYPISSPLLSINIRDMFACISAGVTN